ncbi:MAG: lytic transglycosylase domain-containing protein [Luteimonas sp.]
MVKRGWGLIATLALLTAFPAAGSTLYRCDSGDGIPQYVSKRVSGASCRLVSSAPAAPRSSGMRASRPAVATPTPTPSNVDSGAPATFMGGASSPAPASPAASPRPVVAKTAAPAPAPAPASRAQPGSNQRRLQQGQVYSYVKDGVRHYSSNRPAGGAQVAAVRTIRYSFFETCYACGAAPGVNFGSVRLNENAYRDEVARAAREFGVDEAIVRAIMHAESAFNPNALSRAGAQGLMQLMPATAARFGVVNAFDPEQNIRGGVEYLAWLLKRFNGDLTLAAAGYNAGEGAVQRHGGVPPYAETQRYVVRVGTLADRYRGQLASR